MNRTLYLLVILASIMSTGCEKEVDIDLNAAGDVLVVDASIENNKPPIVYLSNSYHYFSNLSASLLSQSFVRNAIITLNDGSRTVQLKEYAIPVGNNNVYVYTADTANPAQMMLGKLNTQYQLTIKVNNKEYSASTTIPALAKKVDSLWFKVAPNNPDSLKRVVVARIIDPPGLGNYTRYFTSVNDSAFLPGLNSVADDAIIDGTTYNATLSKGFDRNQVVNFDELGYFKKGDYVQTKFCNIDKAHYEFWRTLEYSQQSIGNPFSQPGVVLGNISGGALGYFGGYAAQYKKLIINY